MFILEFVNSLSIYAIIFFAFLTFLFFLALFAIYYLFYELPKTQGQMNRDFISQETARLAAEYKELLKKELNKLLQLNIDFYVAYSSEVKNTMKEEQGKNLELIHSLSQKFNAEMHDTLNDLRQNIHNEELNPHKVLEEKLAIEYDNAIQRVKDHEKLRTSDMDRNIVKILEKVSLTVLNRSLSLDEHNKFILDALDKAKKDVLSL